MSETYKPILLLLFLSAFLTEVFTGNTPIPAFFGPKTFILFVTFGYGFPALIIRELWVRNNFSILSIFTLGFIYGLYNEGLFARSIFHPFHSPVESFALYGLVANIRIPSLLVICSWHPLYAIIFPILFVHYIFPKVAREPWISKKIAWALGIFGVAFGSLAFFKNEKLIEYSGSGEKLSQAQQLLSTGQPEHYYFMIIASLILLIIAYALPRKKEVTSEETPSHKRLSLYGAGLFALFFVLPLLLTVMNIPLPFFLLYFIGAYAFIFKLYKRSRSFSLKAMVILGLYAEIAVIFLGLLIAVSAGTLIQLTFLFIALVVLVVLLRKLCRKTDAVIVSTS